MAKPNLDFDWHSWSKSEFEVGRKKMKEPKLDLIARTLYSSKTHAYRAAKILMLIKERGTIKLDEVPRDFPKSVYYEYIRDLVSFGLIIKNDMTKSYSLTKRFANPLNNFAEYASKWIDAPFSPEEKENLPVVFADVESKGKLQNKPEGSGRQKEIA